MAVVVRVNLQEPAPALRRQSRRSTGQGHVLPKTTRGNPTRLPGGDRSQSVKIGKIFRFYLPVVALHHSGTRNKRMSFWSATNQGELSMTPDIDAVERKRVQLVAAEMR